MIIKKVNPKLYLYKKLFYLSLAVKIQFFKSFILPYFDYCSTLVIYFPKYTIQKLHTFYYTCMIKLFGFCFVNMNCEDVETFLNGYGLMSLEFRILTRLGLFVHRIISSYDSPPDLRALLKEKSCTHDYGMRATDRFIVTRSNSRYGDATFVNFFSRFVNLVLSDFIHLPERDFTDSFIKSIKCRFVSFIKQFD